MRREVADDHRVTKEISLKDRILRLQRLLERSLGWRRCGIAFASGAIAALAHPPFGLFPSIVVSLILLTWLLDGTGHVGDWPLAGEIYESAAIGWWFGFGHYLLSMTWVTAAFFAESDEYAWASPFAAVGLPALVAIPFGLGTALARVFWFVGSRRFVSLALAMFLAEWLRESVFPGLPWNSIGSGFAANGVWMQGVAVFGVAGYNFLVPLLSAPLSAFTLDDSRDRRIAYLCVGGHVFLALLGVFRLTMVPETDAGGPSIRIVQPNIPQAEKWLEDRRAEHIGFTLKLSQTRTSAEFENLESQDLLIWPEAALPTILSRDEAAIAEIQKMLPENTLLLTGGLEITNSVSGARLYNSLFSVNKTEGIVDRFDKIKLVPFGEYLPFSSILRYFGLRALASFGPSNFSAGEERKLIQTERGITILPSICYEIIFSSSLRVPELHDVDLIVNVTNDAWFDNTQEPKQHLHQARLRATEFGLPLARSANTGISAIIDPYGRVIESLPVGVAGVIDGFVPTPLAWTPFRWWGNSMATGFGLVSLILLLYWRFGYHRRIGFPKRND